MSHRTPINIVWLKRDLRTQDHEPLHLAEQADVPYLIVYLIEPAMLEHPDYALRHLQFQYHSLLDMHKRLQYHHQAVHILYADAVPAFTWLFEQYAVQQLFSYRESGIDLTYTRDKAVTKLCVAQRVAWHQCQRDGILRGIQNRDNWDKQWYVQMHKQLIVNAFGRLTTPPCPHQFIIPSGLLAQLEHYPTLFQPASERYAWKYLQTFVEGETITQETSGATAKTTAPRGRNYARHISKPTESRTSCARISPYLAWGNLSSRQVYQFVRGSSFAQQYSAAAKAMLDRLKWRCHFIQKFEMEVEYEYTCINRGYNSIVFEQNESNLAAWKVGMTGFPLVDANMRCLVATGWINFRMRAMVVSFLCHHLFIDWRQGVYHIAQLFLDYEPGIHYPQFQMQAAVTGVNTVRMYNPTKQAHEHDPEGQFIRKWVPELAHLPTSLLFEPWKITAMEQILYQFVPGQHYPMPLVQLEASGARARDALWGHRAEITVKDESKRILKKHTRRTSAIQGSGRRKTTKKT
jgi:deoxyribodipyrimidine photo-lyase